MVMRADIAAAVDRRGPRRRRAPARRRSISRRAAAPFTQDRVRELAARSGRHPALRTVRGHRPARARRARHRGNLDRRLRAVGRRACGAGADRCLRAAAARRGRQRKLARRGELRRGLLEYPHYTRPRDWEGRAIPEVLLSGDHKKIAEWRREQAEKLTKQRRPDLWQRHRKRQTLIEVRTAPHDRCYHHGQPKRCWA